MLRYLVFVSTASLLIAQGPSQVQIKPSTTTPHANETVELEVIGVTAGSMQSIRWDSSGKDKGSFPKGTVGPKVDFVPAKGGEIVIIYCILQGVRTETVPITLTVAQEKAAAQEKAPPAPAGPATKPAEQAPPPPPQPLESLPADLVKIADIVDPSRALVVPSGFMGDAIPEFGKGAARLTGGTDCKFRDGGCYSITYEMARRDFSKSFTAYAWQVLPQGTDTGYNFGQSPGVDLSRMGYRSLRVSARSAPDSMLKSPKVEFKSGGNIDAQFASAHTHSYIVSTGPKTLTESWQEVCLDLSRADLRDVVSPLTVVISSALNPPVNVAVSIDGAVFSKDVCPRR
jgi:hypothetical protein